MKLAMLGTDQQAEGIAAAAAARGNVLVRLPDAAEPSGWEKFLDSASCDAVIVGADAWPAGRADAVRTLVQVGRPLVISQPLELSMLWAWEIEMIRQDVGGVIVPALPSRLHPFIARLRRVLEAAIAGGGPLGTVESIEFDRRLPDRHRETVLRSMSRDADLVRIIAGEPERLSAFGAAPDASAWNSPVVGFSGESLIPVRWQVEAGSEGAVVIVLRCSAGSAVVEIPDDWSQPWKWSGPSHEEAEWFEFDPARAILGVLDAAISRDTSLAADDHAMSPASWADAARAIELAETVPRSLAKGRAIDLHREEFSEIGTFRGTMASLGCGLLLATLALVVVAASLGGIARAIGWDLGERLAAGWPVLVLVSLGIFLLIQLLPGLMPHRRGHEKKCG